MSDDWLWDGGDPPDPDDARVAASLRALARDRACPPLPERPAAPAVPRWRRPRVVVGGLALAAALVAALWSTPRWTVQTLTGARPCAWGPCWLAEEATLTTDAESAWEVQIGDIGALQLGPNSQLARLPTERGHLLRLAQGEVDVSVRAEPGDLRIQTPAADVVDLGCAFALRVDATTTELSVRDGSVALQNDQGTSIVTAGSAASAVSGRRPGLPLRADAPAALVAAVRALEQNLDAGIPADPALADALVAAARPGDLLTLWHALQLVPADGRARLLDGLLAAAPARRADRGALLRLDGGALQALWQDLVPRALGEENGGPR